VDLVRPMRTESVANSLSRLQLLQQRCIRQEKSTTTPIMYRSHLFEPISQSSPAVLVDLIIPQKTKRHDGFGQYNVHVTLYDITYRYDYDGTGWIDKLKTLLAPLSDAASNPGKSSEKFISPGAVTRLFCSVADCNFDYTSSSRFVTATRTIIRLGDLRLSSNVVLPVAPIQAFSLSIGDVSVYLCNSRFPYHFENACLVGSTALLHADDVSLGSLTTLSPDAILHKMNYRTVLMLDSLDSVVAFSNVKPKQSSDPSFRISFTVGEVGLYVCKDSFARLISTVGELTAEMSALSDAAFEALKVRPVVRAGDCDMLYDSIANEAKEEEAYDYTKELKTPGLEDLKRPSTLRPYSETEPKSDRINDFLLDGYDWTAIDTDVSNEVRVPAGEEQAARWYSSAAVESLPLEPWSTVDFSSHSTTGCF
jgi:hypothetical protein